MRRRRASRRRALGRCASRRRASASRRSSRRSVSGRSASRRSTSRRSTSRRSTSRRRQLGVGVGQGVNGHGVYRHGIGGRRAAVRRSWGWSSPLTDASCTSPLEDALKTEVSTPRSPPPPLSMTHSPVHSDNFMHARGVRRALQCRGCSGGGNTGTYSYPRSPPPPSVPVPRPSHSRHPLFSPPPARPSALAGHCYSSVGVACSGV